MMRILVTGRLPNEVRDFLDKEHQVTINTEDRPMERKRLLQWVGDREGLLCMITDQIDEELMAGAPNLRMIANCGVGYDNIDLAAATMRGIPVSNTPDVLTEATADITFALILAVARRVVEGDRMTREGRFRFWAPLHFLGSDVTGKTLGIIGMGRIGRAVARRARGFDMRVIYHTRSRVSEPEEKRLGAVHVSLDNLVGGSDFVSLHVPLTDETLHLVGRRELGMMKPDAYLINTSRGPVVDEQALLEALRDRTIGGAGLDVYEGEPRLTAGLTELANITLLPHVGSATIETRTRMARCAADNLLAGLRGEIPPNCLNCESMASQL